MIIIGGAMNVDGGEPRFKVSSEIADRVSVIYKVVCARPHIDPSLPELKALWDLDEPLAGLDTQVIWLGDEFEIAKRILKVIAPYSRIGDGSEVLLGSRQIVVFREERRPAPALFKRLSREPILVAMKSENAKEGFVAINGPAEERKNGVAVDALLLRVPGTMEEAGAATAAVIAALLTKWPNAGIDDVQNTLFGAAAATNGSEPRELRRVQQNFRPIWNAFEFLEVFESGAPVKRHLRCTSGSGAKLRFEIVAGTLPPGLSFDESGLITGTPLSGHSSIYPVIVRATNDAGTTDREIKIIVMDGELHSRDVVLGLTH